MDTMKMADGRVFKLGQVVRIAAHGATGRATVAGFDDRGGFPFIALTAVMLDVGPCPASVVHRICQHGVWGHEVTP